MVNLNNRDYMYSKMCNEAEDVWTSHCLKLISASNYLIQLVNNIDRYVHHRPYERIYQLPSQSW